MKKQLFLLYLFFAGIIIFLLYLIIGNPFARIPPEGVPDDYFSFIDEIVEEQENDLIIYSNSMTLPDNIITKEYSLLSEILQNNQKLNKFIILDVQEYGELSDSDMQLLSLLYENNCYKIILLNMNETIFSNYSGFVSDIYRNEKFIILSFLGCGIDYYQSIMEYNFTNEEQLEYAIMTVILDMIG
ncbi:MAG: hypothetical protein KKE16_04155 [Firmicutes bacterium]|nr:hypothetical protein [Bacillota bacterium]